MNVPRAEGLEEAPVKAELTRRAILERGWDLRKKWSVCVYVHAARHKITYMMCLRSHHELRLHPKLQSDLGPQDMNGFLLFLPNSPRPH
jgi:hypothetical protein